MAFGCGWLLGVFVGVRAQVARCWVVLGGEGARKSRVAGWGWLGHGAQAAHCWVALVEGARAGRVLLANARFGWLGALCAVRALLGWGG